MPEFAIGQQIRCIRPEGRILSERVYTVISVRHDTRNNSAVDNPDGWMVRVTNDTGSDGTYWSSRFVLADSEPVTAHTQELLPPNGPYKVGDIVRRISDGSYGIPPHLVGEEHEITGLCHGGSHFLFEGMINPNNSWDHTAYEFVRRPGVTGEDKEMKDVFNLTRGKFADWPTVRAQAAMIQQSTKMPVYCINREGKSSDIHQPRRKGVYILFYSRPAHVDKKSVRAKTFGRVARYMLTGEAQNGFCADPKAEHTWTDSSGTPIATAYFVKGSAIVFVLMNLAVGGSTDVNMAIHSIFNYVNRDLCKLIEERKNPEEKYIKLKKAGLEAQKAILLKTIQTQKANYAQYERALMESKKKEESAQKELEKAEKASKEDHNDRLAREFKHIKEHPLVKQVLFDGQQMQIMTVNFDSPQLSDGSIRTLGEYRIYLSRGSMPMLDNLTHRPGDRIHPHSRPGSRTPCWGNLEAGISSLVVEEDYPGILDMVFMFLNNVDELEAYGKSVYHFPFKKGCEPKPAMMPDGTPFVCGHPRHDLYADSQVMWRTIAPNCFPTNPSCRGCCAGDHRNNGACYSR